MREGQLHIGNLLEVAGGGLAVWGVYLIAGLAVALIVAGVLAVVAAEFLYDDLAVKFTLRLPGRKRPKVIDDGVTTVRYRP